jgi:mRNA interferase YafQ
MLKLKKTSRFRRDYKLAKKQGRNLELLESVVQRLLNEETLDPKYKDHALSGEYAGQRACHLQPDWSLIYLVEHDILTLTLTHTGTHSFLYKK